ncbi:hypothetical protein E2C01_083310 [Portunus trituberculatus]|uniref:Uncharacterized protein n=1 Tax=Portunus trituberculatus TaxID=210409 RepID=A0A5B7J1E9_PORTR|nr:hypothetical protein [Portunus trituberculatus]
MKEKANAFWKIGRELQYVHLGKNVPLLGKKQKVGIREALGRWTVDMKKQEGKNLPPLCPVLRMKQNVFPEVFIVFIHERHEFRHR